MTKLIISCTDHTKQKAFETAIKTFETKHIDYFLPRKSKPTEFKVQRSAQNLTNHPNITQELARCLREQGISPELVRFSTASSSMTSNTRNINIDAATIATLNQFRAD